MNKKDRKELEDKITTRIVELLKENKVPTNESFLKKLKKHAKAIAKKTGKIVKPSSKSVPVKKVVAQSKTRNSTAPKLPQKAVNRTQSKIKK